MRLLRTIIVLCVVALIAVGTAAAVPSPRHTKQHAERNLLGATRLLKRWHTGLVNPKTGLLIQNTTAVCTGMGPKLHGGYTKFTCVVKHRKKSVRLLYFAERHNAFGVRRLSH